MIQIDHPFHVDGRGRTATTPWEDHVRDLVEQFLLTAPGERVNRPGFGGGLLRKVFEPNSPELAAALQFTVQAGLQQWVGDLLEVQSLVVRPVDSQLQVTVEYRLRTGGDVRTATIALGGVV